MAVDIIVGRLSGESRSNKSQDYQEDVDAGNFADKLALAKVKFKCRSLDAWQKFELKQRQLRHKRQAEIDMLETEHIRYVKYVNNDELRRGLDKQAMLM